MSREKQIKNLLSRNVVEVIDRPHLERRLLTGEKLRVKLGIDPTSPDLHLGHTVVLRKLKEFQDLDCKAVLIIGDFTARIGDPSGRDKTRPPLNEAAIRINMRKYLDQAGKIVDLKKAEVLYNGSWFLREGVAKILELATAGSIQQMLQREDFKERIARGQDVTVLEALYPLFQGYDSVKVKADVEIGGTDQTFNLLMGRKIQRCFGVPEQDVMTLPLLVGTDGERKMSKSLGNYIGLNDEPDEIFGKIMSVPDKLVEKYFTLCTDLEEQEIEQLKKELRPKELKERLGFEVVKIYHGEKEARTSQDNFEKIFSKKEVPADLPELKVGPGITTIQLVFQSGVTKSRSEARRLVEQGALEIDGVVFKKVGEILSLHSGQTIRIGKKHFFRIRI